ncbi:CAP domain-containing protein [Pseudonocardia sp. TRM90224]|uniref:CAP domain-containing protein n=1 Tax=Pseudonocardia sp. TRM90224 TaxID=2812678 RepID=UPI001E2D9763|nr:CAP domain-containing protein [Pseudonocardia sp. TRM90224]
MRRAALLAPLVFLLAVFGVPATANAGPLPANLNPTEITQAVNAHNQVRQQVGVPMPNVTWDAGVAAVAQDWANQQAAKMKAGQAAPVHRPNNQYGENLQWAWATPNAPNPAPTVPVTSWANEKPFYNYATNSCAAGKQCKHYTQIVWKATTKIGCGRATWTVGTKNWILWVCNYSPKGNISGQKPY